MNAQEYHQDPALSASLVRTMLAKSPRHAWYESPALNPDWQPREDDAKFDLGTAAHALLLEGEAGVFVCQYDSWRKGEAQEARDLARSHGKVPLLAKDWQRVQDMANAIDLQLNALKIDPPLLADGTPEVTLTWEEDGLRCKARLDWLRDDFTAIDDVKTTGASAHPDAWTKTAYGMGADVQARWYQRAVAKTVPTNLPDFVMPAFRFIVVENRPPYALSVISLSKQAEALADSKIERALTMWRDCLSSGVFPAYPTETCYIDAPSWAEYQWLEREAREEAAA